MIAPFPRPRLRPVGPVRALRFASATLVAAVVFWFPPESLSAQTIGGLVAEQGSLAPVSDAVLTLFEVTPDGELRAVGTSTSNEQGSFRLNAPAPGTYVVQADHDGLSSPPSEEIRLAAGDVNDSIALILPSRLLMLGYECHGEDESGGAAVVGILRDRASEIPVPDAIVTARWEGRDGSPTFLTTETDGAGRYRLCGVPHGDVTFQARALGREAAVETLDLPRAAIVFHDLQISLGSGASGDRGVIQERLLVEAAAHGLGDLMGQIVDQDTDAPVNQAVVRLRGTGFQGTTDREGRFAFMDLRPGTYQLEIQHLGYSVQTDEVEVPEGRDVQLRLRIAPTAIEVDGIEVTVRSAVEAVTRLSPFRRDMVYGSAMAVEESRGSLAPDILRRNVPGLRVTETYRDGGPPILCIQTNRRVQGMEQGCASAQLIVDGVRISDPDYLRTFPASEIESIEFLPPSQAQTIYGTGGATSNGVVVIYTRGKGPYVSELRNRP
jgi:hypothetical protein